MCTIEGRSGKFLLVMNSESGKGITRQKRSEIIKQLRKNGCRFKVVDLDILKNIKNVEDYDAVIVAGGDGTILEVIPYLANKDIKLGIIPCGTANLFAASLCIPKNTRKAIEILSHGNDTKVDVGKAGNKYFALRIGIGYDADVVNGASAFLKHKIGYLAYFIQGIISCFKLSRKSYKITLDDKQMEIKANSIIVANAGNMFKNLFTVAPSGKLNDGELDVFILLAKDFWEFLMVFLQILLGKQDLCSGAIYGKAQTIKIESNYRNAHIDGEPYTNSSLDISVIPSALKVMIP